MTGIQISADNAHKDELRESRWTRESHRIIPLMWTLRVRKAMLYVYIYIYAFNKRYLHEKNKDQMWDGRIHRLERIWDFTPLAMFNNTRKRQNAPIGDKRPVTTHNISITAPCPVFWTSGPNGCLCACNKLLCRRGTLWLECLNILQQARNLLAFV